MKIAFLDAVKVCLLVNVWNTLQKGQKIVNRGEWQVRAGRKGSMACVLPQSGFPSLCTALLMPCISLKVFSVFLSNHSEYFPQIFSLIHIFQCIIMHTFDIVPPWYLFDITIVHIWRHTCSWFRVILLYTMISCISLMVFKTSPSA